MLCGVIMKLAKFKVTNFRSVRDSGWIEIDDVLALLGINESGKSNILLALWKLKPARDGKINLKYDAPRSDFSDYRVLDRKPIFIEAVFKTDDKVLQRLHKLTKLPLEQLDTILVKRDLGGNYIVDFPHAEGKEPITKSDLLLLISDYKTRIETVDIAGKRDEIYKESILPALDEIISNAPELCDAICLHSFKDQIQSKIISSPLVRSTVHPLVLELIEGFTPFFEVAEREHPKSNEEVKKLVIESIPAFVYYSTYGNLDSEIYLPHVIDNMQRNDIGPKEIAKVRTLRVLFEYVKLKPDEILKLGKEKEANNQKLTPQQIEQDAEAKGLRVILLNSAATSLTKRFEKFWQQGNYIFTFQADGSHFRIWVSDGIRPDKIELESRSSGLQWFLSFFLVFLVEMEDAHQNAILLLDEPGSSLHALAQQDLFQFFDRLTQKNQVLYTTHSTFMVDFDRLDRVRVVYYEEEGDEKGLTQVSDDLRIQEKNSGEIKSLYPVHAALGLAVSPFLLQGCQSVIVEGISDQFYCL